MRLPTWELQSLRLLRSFDAILDQELGWENLEKEPELCRGLKIHNPQNDDRAEKLSKIQVADRVVIVSGEHFNREGIVRRTTLKDEQIYIVEIQADLESLAASVKEQKKAVKAIRQSTEKDRTDKLLKAKERLRELETLVNEKTQNPSEGTAPVDVDDLELKEELDTELNVQTLTQRKTLTVKRIVFQERLLGHSRYLSG